MPGKPDRSVPPFHLTVERQMPLAPRTLYLAWTEHIDGWFAAPGTVKMRPLVGEPFFFETRHEGKSHPHYGRFLRLDPDQWVKLAWVTGAGGTLGAETTVTVELIPREGGTLLRLTHAGFQDAASRDQHEQVWPLVLKQLEERLKARVF